MCAAQWEDLPARSHSQLNTSQLITLCHDPSVSHVNVLGTLFLFIFQRAAKSNRDKVPWMSEVDTIGLQPNVLERVKMRVQSKTK